MMGPQPNNMAFYMIISACCACVVVCLFVFFCFVLFFPFFLSLASSKHDTSTG